MNTLVDLSSFPVAWAVIFVIVGCDALWEARNWLKIPSAWIPLSFFSFFICINVLSKALNAAEIGTSSNVRMARARVTLALEYIALLTAAGYALSLLVYLNVTLGFPLVDQKLNAADQWMGFDWLGLFAWSQNAFVHEGLHWAYQSLVLQGLVFTCWFSYRLKRDRLVELFWILFIALIMTLIISGLWPALGPVAFFSVEPQFSIIEPGIARGIRDVISIRKGPSSGAIIEQIHGIVTFPSFHTVCAVVYAYGFRRTGLMAYVMIVLNAVMVISIPFFGNHYFADVAAGLGVAIIAILFVRCMAWT